MLVSPCGRTENPRQLVLPNPAPPAPQEAQGFKAGAVRDTVVPPTYRGFPGVLPVDNPRRSARLYFWCGDSGPRTITLPSFFGAHKSQNLGVAHEGHPKI